MFYRQLPECEPDVFCTTGTPTQYNIVWDAGALSAGFANVTLATLPSSPIVISVPPASAGIYAGTLTVKNACGNTSANNAISVTINAVPTIA